jgi:nucleotide-binding universal stress UspA family protein
VACVTSAKLHELTEESILFKHILIAHDLSHQADVALRRAAQLANQHKARLTLLHVVETPHSESEMANLRSSAEQILGRLASFNHCEAVVRLEQGKPNEIILKLLNNEDVDLLVLGAHHKTRPELFTGTNLDRLARLSTVPVLLAVNEDGGPYQLGIVAVDFSLCACNALHHAYQLLPSSAKLLGLNIFATSSRLAKRDREDRLEMQRLLIGQLMIDEASRLPNEGPTLEHEVIPGTLSGSLDEAISQNRPQLLALGRHNRGVLAQALLGSLAQHYLNKAPCDVLLVR